MLLLTIRIQPSHLSKNVFTMTPRHHKSFITSLGRQAVDNKYYFHSLYVIAKRHKWVIHLLFLNVVISDVELPTFCKNTNNKLIDCFQLTFTKCVHQC